MKTIAGDVENGRATGRVLKPTAYPSFRKSLSEYFADYSQQTTIHGVRHVGNRRLSGFERLWWLVTIGISIALCYILIEKTYDKWKSSPVIVSFAKTSTPIWKIPFPAVTLCPTTKAKQRLYNYTDMYVKLHGSSGNMTKDELMKFDQISLLCDNHPYDNGSKTMDSDGLNFFSKVAPTFTDTFWMCAWLNQNETCDTLFRTVFTDEGVCYTFNMIDGNDLFSDDVFHNDTYPNQTEQSMEWDLDKGYAEGVQHDTYPRRALAAGQKGNFAILLTLYEEDLDYLCKGSVQGYKVHMHHPGEVPAVSQQSFWVPMETNVVVSITPKMMTTSEALSSYDSKIRGCYFSHERPLRYFKFYTQRNCEIECLTNHTLKTCGCVAFHMPRNESTKICGSGSSKCVDDCFDEVAQRQDKMDIVSMKDGLHGTVKERCDCLPSCTMLAYDITSTFVDFRWQEMFAAYRTNFSEIPGNRLTRLNFSFKMAQFFPSERNELFGATDFISHCGGLLGLCIGFSLLSLLEVLYFLTLRLLGNVAMYGSHYWSGSPELLAKKVPP